jgi:hypothetical protein
MANMPCKLVQSIRTWSLIRRQRENRPPDFLLREWNFQYRQVMYGNVQSIQVKGYLSVEGFSQQLL